MPQAKSEIKRIVSTHFPLDKRNPLQSAKMDTAPFLVMRNGTFQLVDAQNFGGEWDVMILSDSEAPGLDKKLEKLSGVIEVLWLHHNWNVTLQQEECLRGYFDKAEFKRIPFSHGPNDYKRYLEKVAALWDKNSNNYLENLTELDRALRSEEMESDICDFLWLWAAYRDAKENGLDTLEPLKSAFINKRDKVVDHVTMLGADINVYGVGANSTNCEYATIKNTLKKLLESHQVASSGASGS